MMNLFRRRGAHDAMEACHPGLLARLVEAELTRYVDPLFDAEVRRVRREALYKCNQVREAVLERYQDEIAQAEEDLEAAAQRVKELQEQIAEEVREEAPHQIVFIVIAKCVAVGTFTRSWAPVLPFVRRIRAWVGAGPQGKAR